MARAWAASAGREIPIVELIPAAGTGSWGLGVVESDDEDAVRAFAAGDPVVTTGTARIEVGKMLSGFVRPREVT